MCKHNDLEHQVKENACVFYSSHNWLGKLDKNKIS